MTPVEIGIAGLLILVLLLAIRVPIGLALIGVSYLGTSAIVGHSVAFRMLSASPFQFTASWTLSSIPMFLLMGFVCFHSGMTDGLFKLAKIGLRRLPGGLACAGVAGAAGFSFVSGSSVATAAAMGRIAVPEMLASRYDPALATGSLAAAGTIGALIPPSIIMILYGIFASVPISHLFAGGLLVGVTTAVIYIAVIVIRVLLKPELGGGRSDPVPRKEAVAAAFEAIPTIFLVVLVFGGLFSGVFTATEAGAVGAVLAAVIAMLFGRLNGNLFMRALFETTLTSASLFIIVIGASMLTRFMALSGVGGALTNLLLFAGDNRILLLLIIALIYLLIGMFLEPMGAMLLTLPIVLPAIAATGIDKIWFGIILLKLLEVGVLTPPIGMNIFVIKSVVPREIGLSTIMRGVIWFVVADLILVLLLILFPDLLAAPLTWLSSI